MTGKHATLSPSSAERWSKCPASVRMASKALAQEESSYAREGTAAHELAYITASLAFSQITPAKAVQLTKRWRRDYDITEIVEVEMRTHVTAYVALLEERMAVYPHSTLSLEQRMDTGVPGCWGTADAVIASPTHVEIIDFKYGAGVAVQAVGNPQLRLYGCGALETFGDILGNTETIITTVHQPRMDHILSEELTADELRAWRTNLLPVAEEALAGSHRFAPSDDTCRWCPVSGRCRAQFEAATQLAFGDDPELLSPQEMSDVQAQLPTIRTWLAAFEEALLSAIYKEGKHVPGYKVVQSGGQRRVRDNDAAVQALVEAGLALEEVTVTKARGIGDLEKLCKAAGVSFADLLETPGYVAKGEGRPSVVPDSDSRPSIDPNSEAAKDFGPAAD